MNISKEQYDMIIKRLNQSELDRRILNQQIIDLEQQIDYQTKSLNNIIDQVEQLQEVIEEELA